MTSNKKLPVVEMFGPTVQGEGSVIGYQTIFLRMGGCDYMCERCDSLHAVLPELMREEPTFTQLTAEELIPHVRDFVGHTEWITLSGGNPCMWKDLGDVIWALGMDENGPQKKFALETQGTLWQHWIPWCTKVTVSPKGPGMGEKFEPEKFDRFVHELRGDQKPWHPGFSVKVPVFDQRDLEFVVSILELWPQLAPVMFLSIGNIYPPAPAKQGPRNLEGKILGTNLRQGADAEHEAFVHQVLKSYKVILEDVMQDPRLSSVRILPQLHTLLYGNAKGK